MKKRNEKFKCTFVKLGKQYWLDLNPFKKYKGRNKKK